MTGTYTVREVAELLAVSRSTVERLLADRTLTRVKVRRAVRARTGLVSGVEYMAEMEASR